MSHLRTVLFGFALLVGWTGWHAVAATPPTGTNFDRTTKARFDPATASLASVSALTSAESPDDDDGDDIAPAPVGHTWGVPALEFTSRAAFAPPPLALRDRRASTLVGVVVLLI